MIVWTMRSTKTWLLTAPLFLLLGAPPAGASEGGWTLLLSPGFSFPVGKPGQGDRFHTQHEGSFHMQASIDYEVEEGGWVGAELGYSTGHRFKGVMNSSDFDGDGAADSVSFDSDIDTAIFHLTPFLKVGGPLNPFLNFYFSVGAGLYSFWSRAGTASLSGAGTTGTSLSALRVPFDRAANSFFGFNLGHGLGYEVAESLEMGINLRYHLIFQPGDTTGIAIPGAQLLYYF